MRKKEKIQRLVMRIFLTLMVSSFYTFNNTALSSWGIVVFAILLLVSYFLFYGFTIRLVFIGFHKKSVLFAIFCLLSAIWSSNPIASLTEGGTIVKILLCMAAVFVLYFEEKSIEDLLSAIMWSGPVIAVFSIVYYGYGVFVGLIETSTRLENTFVNSNAIGMWMAVSIVVFIYYLFHKGWKWRYAFIGFPILVLAMSQSRTALIECVFGVLFVTISTIRIARSSIKNVIRILVIGVIIIIGVQYLMRLPLFSGLTGRMSQIGNVITGEGMTDSSAIVRRRMIIEGWNSFLSHPLIGVGMANTGQISYGATGHYTYLHNNYIDLLAGGGIFAFLLFYSFYFELIPKLYVKLRKKVQYSDICLSILLIQLIADIGTVSYYSKSTYFVLLMCYLLLYQSDHNAIILDPLSQADSVVASR